MRVTVISHERIGDRMAGPAIRSWEFARVLSNHFTTTLAAPDTSSIPDTGFDLHPFSFDDEKSLLGLEHHLRTGADVVVSSGHLVKKLPLLCDLAIPWVADVYIPIPVESLAFHRLSESDLAEKAYAEVWESTRAMAGCADFFICASERQRDFWLGILASFGRLRPQVYAADPEARNLIDVVPFGCPASPPTAKPVLKGQWPGVMPEDKILLWGGGIWNWLDPLTLIRALPHVLKRHPRAKLLFLGADHPDSARVPQMRRAREARSLSREMGMEGETILWGDWVPYEERGPYLLEADIGVALHHKGLEARLAFRTRLLDAIWAGLPMVLSRGDVLSETFTRRGLGMVVDYGAVDQVATAVGKLLDEPDPRGARWGTFARLRDAFSWDHVTEPLVRFCEAPWKAEGEQRWARFFNAGAEIGNWQEAELRAEVRRLQETVEGYRSGRIMRLLERLHRLRQALGLAKS